MAPRSAEPTATGAKNISDALAVFHDGVIVAYKASERSLELTIEILYLAERVSPSFRHFTLALEDVSGMHLCAWPKDRSAPAVQLTELDAVFGDEPELFGAVVNGDSVDVTLNQDRADSSYCGGTLRFRASRARVWDEAGTHYSLASLRALSQSYWDEWSSRTPKP